RLPLSAGEAEDGLVDRVDADLEAPHLLLGAAAHRLLVQESEPGQGRRTQLLAAEEEVARGVEVLREREVLVDGLDAELARLAWVRDGDGSAVDRDLAGVGLVDAGENLDQRRLAGPVVADERVHLVRPEREVALAQCHDTSEVLLDVPRFEQRRWWRRLRHRRDDIVVIDSVTIPGRGACVKRKIRTRGHRGCVGSFPVGVPAAAPFPVIVEADSSAAEARMLQAELSEVLAEDPTRSTHCAFERHRRALALAQWYRTPSTRRVS